MQPEAPALMWDARRAAGRVLEFVAGRSGSARSIQPTADQVPDLARIVAFRNVLLHGYAQIDDALAWEVALTRVPE